MKEIPLTKGFVALVDDEDEGWLREFKWHVKTPRKRRTQYAYTAICLPGRERYVSMHALLVCPLPGQQVDHRDGSGLNNQKFNLRVATGTQQRANVALTAQNSSGFKGVLRDHGKWRAQIGHTRNGTRLHLGMFSDPKVAAAAYDEAALKMYGDFARTNKMLGLI